MPHKIKKIREYDILEKLKESNYALIYRVKDSDNNTTVLKLAREASPEYNESIAREFQVLSQFKHHNIVPMYAKCPMSRPDPIFQCMQNVQCPAESPVADPEVLRGRNEGT